MKQLSLLSIILLLLVSCTPQADPGTKELDEVCKQNVELVKKWATALENEDIDALKEIYSPDAVCIGPRHDQTDTVDDEYWNSQEEWFASVDSIHLDIENILPKTIKEGELAGDWVLVWGNIHWYNIKAEKELIVMYHSPMRIEDGKIVYEVSYWNQWDLFKQLGAELDWPDCDGDDDDDDEN